MQHYNILEKIKKLLLYTTNSKTSYNGQLYEYGYHTLKIDNSTLKGQRNPAQRLENLPYDFTNKVILDIGSNQGGMLFEIADKIKEGVGIDFNPKLVNAANRISNYKNLSHINFYHFDLNTEDFDLIRCFTNYDKFDVVFLLSVCMWIDHWKDLINWISKNSKVIIFETNGNKKQQREQIVELEKYFKISVINESSEDDPKQKNRKLLLCQPK